MGSGHRAQILLARQALTNRISSLLSIFIHVEIKVQILLVGLCWGTESFFSWKSQALGPPHCSLPNFYFRHSRPDLVWGGTQKAFISLTKTKSLRKKTQQSWQGWGWGASVNTVLTGFLGVAQGESWNSTLLGGIKPAGQETWAPRAKGLLFSFCQVELLICH